MLHITWGARGELVYDVLPSKEKSKGASSEKWHPIKAHLAEFFLLSKTLNSYGKTDQYVLPHIDNGYKSSSKQIGTLDHPRVFKF